MKCHLELVCSYFDRPKDELLLSLLKSEASGDQLSVPLKMRLLKILNLLITIIKYIII